MIIEPCESGASQLRGRSRVLLINSGTAHLIALTKVPSAPYRVDLDTLEIDLAEGRVLEVTSDPITSKHPVTREQLSPSAEETYNKYWRWLNPIMQRWPTTLISDTEKRNRVLLKRADKVGVRFRLLKEILFRYWAGGYEPLAIAPAFYCRGGKGVTQASGSKRRGRRASTYGHVSNVLSVDCRESLEKGIRRFIKSEGRQIDEAYELTIRNYFTDSDNQKNTNPIGLTSNQPSRWQFDRALRRLRTQGEIKSRRPSARRGPRVRTGTARDGVFGPGVRYEVDFTTLPIDLISVFDNTLHLGTPVYYHVPDVYSRVLTGFHVTLENGSWAAARLALAHSFTPKVEACRDIGIEIKTEDWPCNHLPQVISADRGEFAGDAADTLPDELGVSLDLEPPYKPDGKSIVERLNRYIKEGRLKTLPGARLFNTRGKRVRARYPCVTLPAVRRALTSIVIQLNHDPVPADKIPALMIQDGWKTASRLDIWRWGMQRLMGGGRTRDPRSVYFALLKKAAAKIRHDGLYFKGFRYMSAGLRDSGLLEKALHNGAFEVPIRYDDYIAARVWLFDKSQNDWDLLELIDRDIIKAEASFEEAVLLGKHRIAIRSATFVANSEKKAHFDQIVKEEAEDAAQTVNKDSPRRGANNKGRLRKNRRTEKAIGRSEHTHTVIESFAEAAVRAHAPKKLRAIYEAGIRTGDTRRARLLALSRDSILKPTRKEQK